MLLHNATKSDFLPQSILVSKHFKMTPDLINANVLFKYALSNKQIEAINKHSRRIFPCISSYDSNFFRRKFTLLSSLTFSFPLYLTYFNVLFLFVLLLLRFIFSFEIYCFFYVVLVSSTTNIFENLKNIDVLLTAQTRCNERETGKV